MLAGRRGECLVRLSARWKTVEGKVRDGGSGFIDDDGHGDKGGGGGLA